MSPKPKPAAARAPRRNAAAARPLTPAPVAARWTESLPALRWAVLGLLAAGAVWAGAQWLPQRAAYIDGGALFGAYLCLCGWLLAAAGAWTRGDLKGLGWPALLLSPLVAWLFYVGAQVSGEAMVNFGAIPWFAAGTLLWAALSAAGGGEGPAPGPAPRPWLWAALLLVGGLALAALVVWLRNWTHSELKWPEDRTSVDMLLVGRDGGGATDIAGGPFVQQAWLAVVALWAAAVGAVVALRDRVGAARMPWALFILALLGKIALAGLSTSGLGIIALKIGSVNTNYFTAAGLISGPWAFLRDFNANQATAGFHVNTHPPLPVLEYWVLRGALFSSPLAVAFAIMALSAAAVWPLYRLGRGLGGDEGGLAAAGLFITSPLSLILGNAGIDSVVFTLVALSVWCLWEAVEARSWRWAAASGASLGLATLNSFGSSASLVFLGTWGLLLLWRRRRSLDDFLMRNAGLWGAFSAALLAVHLALFAASLGHFNYLAAVHTAQYVHLSANEFRPFELWSWANVVLYAGYTGLGLLALWILRAASSLARADHSDPAVLVSAATLVTLIMTAYGRAEVQRQYLFGAVFLLPVAAGALPRNRDGRLQWQGLAVALGLNALGAVALQIWVLDYW